MDKMEKMVKSAKMEKLTKHSFLNIANNVKMAKCPKLFFHIKSFLYEIKHLGGQIKLSVKSNENILN